LNYTRIASHCMRVRRSLATLAAFSGTRRRGLDCILSRYRIMGSAAHASNRIGLTLFGRCHAGACRASLGRRLVYPCAILPPTVKADGYQVEYVGAGGGKTWLHVGVRHTVHCAQLRLPVVFRAVRWVGLISPRMARELTQGVLLVGRDGIHRFRVSEITPLAPRTQGAPPAMRARAFGEEGRARVRVLPQGITVTCVAGRSPAGVVVFDGSGASGGDVDRVVIQYVASGTFGLGVADVVRQRREMPLRVGALPPRRTPGVVALPLPAGSSALGRVTAWTIVCPRQAARLTLRTLRLGRRAAKRLFRATWIWQARRWRETPAALLAGARNAGLDRLFVTVPLTENARRVARPDALAHFIAAAAARGIQVWAVLGAPGAVLPAEWPTFVRAARAYRAYNRRVPIVSRSAGVQYDIEPYLNRGYALNPAAWLAAYVKTLKELRGAGEDMPLDAVVPFWWGRQRLGGAALLDQLAPWVDHLTVMDYRTDPAQIRRFAEPFLAWGQRAGRPVRIALEAGPVADESALAFRPSASGALWRVTVGGRPVLILLDLPQHNPAGVAYRCAAGGG